MILELKRTKRGSKEYTYDILQNKQIIGHAGFPVGFKMTELHATIQLLGQTIPLTAHLPIYMPRRKTNDKLNHIETGCFAINDQRGIVLTNLAVADHEKQKYHYWAVSHPDYDFQAYEIGLGLKGIFLALKTGDSTLGVVSKATKSVNYKSKYTIYVESSTFVPFAVLMALYWDAAQYFYSDASDEYGAFLGFHTEYHHFKSKQQELRNKYDPSFILRIKEMDK